MIDHIINEASKIAEKLERENKRLRAALADARDALRNDFEPDNQSRAWHRANDTLNRTE